VQSTRQVGAKVMRRGSEAGADIKWRHGVCVDSRFPFSVLCLGRHWNVHSLRTTGRQTLLSHVGRNVCRNMNPPYRAPLPSYSLSLWPLSQGVELTWTNKTKM